MKKSPNIKILNKWKAFYKSKGIYKHVQLKYLKYINGLLEKNVPIIFDFEHLSLLLGRKSIYLSSVVNCSEHHYRTFKIKKRSGGYRSITSPYPALLEIQYWIYDNILKSISIDSSAHGFVQKKSIITNSKIHIGQHDLLKLDLKDYFPSIKINRIIFIFKQLGYPNNIAFYLASICCYMESLPQGAPTSPCLSNIVSKQLDKRLLCLSKKYQFRYTRYADDMTFSGKNIPAKFIEYVSTIIEDEGFEVNTSKTRLYNGNRKKIVTGISVSGNKIKLPREYKRNLKQELYYIQKFGLDSHIKKKKIRKSNYLYSISGKLNFWLSVEPKNITALEAKKMIKEIIKSN